MSFSFPFISPFLFAILATVGIAAWSLISRHMLKNEKDYMAVAAVNENLATAMLLIVLGIFGVSAMAQSPFVIEQIPTIGWLAFAASVLLYTSTAILSYKVFQQIEATERAVVTQVQIVWIVLLGVLLLGEQPGPEKLLAALLVMTGAYLCTYKPGHAHLKKEGIKLAVIVALLYGTATLSDKVVLNYFPPLFYALFMFLVPGTAVLCLMGKNRAERIKRVWKKYQFKFLLFAFLSIAPFIAFLLALRGMQVSVVGPLVNTNVILTALGGFLLLGEKENWEQKLAGALLAFVGMWMLGGG